MISQTGAMGVERTAQPYHNHYCRVGQHRFNIFKGCVGGLWHPFDKAERSLRR
jgi:hypothetical protein